MAAFSKLPSSSAPAAFVRESPTRSCIISLKRCQMLYLVPIFCPHGDIQQDVGHAKRSPYGVVRNLPTAQSIPFYNEAVPSPTPAGPTAPASLVPYSYDPAITYHQAQVKPNSSQKSKMHHMQPGVAVPHATAFACLHMCIGSAVLLVVNLYKPMTMLCAILHSLTAAFGRDCKA